MLQLFIAPIFLFTLGDVSTVVMLHRYSVYVTFTFDVPNDFKCINMKAHKGSAFVMLQSDHIKQE